MQYLITKKIKILIEKSIINYYLIEIINIINKLLIVVEKRHDI